LFGVKNKIRILDCDIDALANNTSVKVINENLIDIQLDTECEKKLNKKDRRTESYYYIDNYN